MKSFITTTHKVLWQKAVPKTGTRQGDNPLRISGKPAQTILGFGGCFNELGAKELFRLPIEQRSKILEDLFSDEGCAFNFCRIPIGASDYAFPLIRGHWFLKSPLGAWGCSMPGGTLALYQCLLGCRFSTAFVL